MSKKKPSPPEESSDLFGTQPRKKSVRKGRPPVLPKGFEAYMDDLTQHSEAWITRFREVWFMGPERPFERPSLAGKDQSDVLERYEDAIETLRVMAKCAKDGQTWLAKGQASAKEVLAKKKASKRPKAEQSSGASGSDEEQCSVMDELEKL
jgi:hypothetical protein